MNKNSNADVINALVKAEALILILSTQGVKVNSVTLRNDMPVIRISRHSWCDRMMVEGRAHYTRNGQNHHGRYRQGMYADESGCRVVWSESIH